MKFPEIKQITNNRKKGKIVMAKKFQLLEASSGGEVGDQIEADTYGEAAAEILESMGYQLLEIEDEKEE